MSFRLETRSALTKKLGLGLCLLLILSAPVGMARAQGSQPAGPIYIVKAGDVLWQIAQRFGVSTADLASYNNITDPSMIEVGQALVIPGLEDIQGTLDTITVPFGETALSLGRHYGMRPDVLERLNRLVNPNSLYAGASLVITQESAARPEGKRIMLSQGQSLLELAVLSNSDPWTILQSNNLSGGWQALPGDVLQIPGQGDQGPGGLPGFISSIEIVPRPVVQGKTEVVHLAGASGMELSGSFVGHPLNFFSAEAGQYVALQGIHAMTTPGVYPFTLSGKTPEGINFSFTQPVVVKDGEYPYEYLIVNPETVDPAVTGPEDKQWNALSAPVTPDRLWSGAFVSPVEKDFSRCFTDYFGNRRSFNNGPYNFFHTGLDFCGSTGQDIYAVAAGVVVFTGPLIVRGNATMIDHGWGVYTAYEHQSEILVKVGDRVEAGQKIGLIGETGRVNGPHLHFEVWAGGVQVDPMDWLNNTYP